MVSRRDGHVSTRDASARVAWRAWVPQAGTSSLAQPLATESLFRGRQQMRHCLLQQSHSQCKPLTFRFLETTMNIHCWGNTLCIRINRSTAFSHFIQAYHRF
jgi:hypothetical protein